MTTRITLLIAAVAIAFGLHAKEVTSSAGSLCDAVGADTLATSLSVSGTLNAADFDFIDAKMSKLQSLDLSHATIEAYSGEPLVLSRRTSSPAGVLPEFSLFGTRATTVALPSGITEIGESALAGSAVTSIVIPSSVTVIGNNAFAASSIESVTVPNSVTSLGAGVFKDCTRLTSVAINGSVAIPDECFSGCQALESVTLSSDVTAIGNSAFAGTSALAGIVFPGNLKVIGDYAFNHSGLETADLTSCAALSSIGQGAFENCGKLRSAFIPKGVDVLSKGIFFGDSALEDMTVDGNLTKIGGLAFAGASSMVNTPLNGNTSSVSEIGDYAFSGVDKIESVVLPATLTYIGSGAMEGMTGLKKICAANLSWVPELGADVWKGVDQKNVDLIVKDNMIGEYKSTPQWELFNITNPSGVDSVNDDAVSGFNVNARFDGGNLLVEANQPIGTIAVYDVEGRLGARLELSDTVAEIDLSDLSARLYIVEVYSLDNNERRVFKLAKK